MPREYFGCCNPIYGDWKNMETTLGQTSESPRALEMVPASSLMVLFILGTRFQPNPIVDRSLMVTGAHADAVAQAQNPSSIQRRPCPTHPEQGDTGIDRFGHFADEPAAIVTQCMQED
jgi:hypothetical protein